jgi:hypothetical protein
MTHTLYLHPHSNSIKGRKRTDWNKWKEKETDEKKQKETKKLKLHVCLFSLEWRDSVLFFEIYKELEKVMKWGFLFQGSICSGCNCNYIIWYDISFEMSITLHRKYFHFSSLTFVNWFLVWVGGVVCVIFSLTAQKCGFFSFFFACYKYTMSHIITY